MISCLSYAAIMWLICMAVPQLPTAVFTSDVALSDITIWAIRIYMAGSILMGCLLYTSPFVVVVKKGKAIKANIGTVEGHDAHERKMNEKEKRQLRKIYDAMFEYCLLYTSRCV